MAFIADGLPKISSDSPTGMRNHMAILYPTRALLADALRRLLAAGIELDGAADHGVSEALYLRDPDGNSVELYWDRPREQWPRTPGRRPGDVHAGTGLECAAG
jgi:catechol-2,3-dioxygenase